MFCCQSYSLGCVESRLRKLFIIAPRRERNPRDDCDWNTPTRLRDPVDANATFESFVEVRAPEGQGVQPARVPRHGQRGRAGRSCPGEPRVGLAVACCLTACGARLVRALLLLTLVCEYHRLGRDRDRLVELILMREICDDQEARPVSRWDGTAAKPSHPPRYSQPTSLPCLGVLPCFEGYVEYLNGARWACPRKAFLQRVKSWAPGPFLHGLECTIMLETPRTMRGSGARFGGVRDHVIYAEQIESVLRGTPVYWVLSNTHMSICSISGHCTECQFSAISMVLVAPHPKPAEELKYTAVVSSNPCAHQVRIFSTCCCVTGNVCCHRARKVL